MSYLIKQFINKVEDFSSQYGGHNTISYVAENMVGKPLTIPTTNDSTRSYSLKTYGDWGEKKKFFEPSFYSPSIPNEEFIDVFYKIPVRPRYINIYQVCHSGSVVRIWGSLKGTTKWTLLWSGKPHKSDDRRCVLNLMQTLLPTQNYVNLLRIEMDTSLQLYYPSFDAIMLVGLPFRLILPQLIRIFSPKYNFVYFHTRMFHEMLRDGLNYVTELKFKTLPIESTSENIQSDGVENGGFFNSLPREVIHLILRKVDIQTLCRISSCCRLLHSCASDPLLYEKVDLKSVWHIVNDGTLNWLKSRCHRIKALDMARCGNYGSMTSKGMIDFIVSCGSSLHTLILDNCQFITIDVLKAIGLNCRKLNVLSLSKINQDDYLKYVSIAVLPQITYLNLSYSCVETSTIVQILYNYSDITQLKLTGCHMLTNMNKVAILLPLTCPNLTHFEIFRTKGLMVDGLRSLGRLKHLQVADLGWSVIGVVTMGMVDFLKGCTKLRVLSFNALRTLQNCDVLVMAMYGLNLEQIEIMGSRNVSVDAVSLLLSRCQQLQLLDVSFCTQIRKIHVVEWKKSYPKVSFKHYFEHT